MSSPPSSRPGLVQRPVVNEVATPRSPQPRIVASAELFGDAQEVQIEHLSQVYRLRRTSLGKLILTK